MTSSKVTELKIVAKDDVSLSACHYPPQGSQRTNKIMVISSASGVKKETYDSFARYLASHGTRVYTFDYRGIGGSLTTEVKGSNACLSEWGSKDLSGVLGWVSKKHSEENVFLLAHGIAGHLLGLASNCVRIKGIVLVTCPHGYWGNWSPMIRSILAPALFVIFPLLTKILKYFPAKIFGLGENLPAGVAKEWLNWARDRNYLLSAHPYVKERLGALQVPVLVYSFKDDLFAPQTGIKKFLDNFSNSSKQWNHIAPKDLHLRSIGHFGFFKADVEKTLWNDTRNWLQGF